MPVKSKSADPVQNAGAVSFLHRSRNFIIDLAISKDYSLIHPRSSKALLEAILKAERGAAPAGGIRNP